MSPDQTKTDVPKGSYAAGEKVKIPAGAEQPFTVFMNGVQQTAGEDFNVEGSVLHFTRPIIKEEVGISRWLAMYLGLFGTYRKDEKIDLQFYRDGKVELVPDLPIVPYEDEEGESAE